MTELALVTPQQSTPFDFLIDQYSSLPSDKKFIIGFLRAFRVLHIDAKKIPFGPKFKKDFCQSINDNTRLKLIFFEIITQLNICSRMLRKNKNKSVPKFNEIRLFRNMCIEHYDAYITLANQGSFGFLISRQDTGVFPKVEYSLGKNEPPKYLKIKNDLKSAVQNLGIDCDHSKIDHLFNNYASDQSYTLLYGLLDEASKKKNKEKGYPLRNAIWNFGLPSPFSDTDQYFQDEFLPFILDFFKN